ncbi:MAG: tryptophan synthase subunit alpha [Planctomycetes bacterium]|nr:tryptophan synthase subunit alpha [Planctomycetota bacterium]
MTIRQAFDSARTRGRMALVPYLTGGFPNRDVFAHHLHTVAQAGADLLEIGVPFSDPIADGPTIQHSSQTALAAGATLDSLLQTLRATPTPQPRVLMSYLNPLLAYGPQRLLAAMRDADATGLIIADLPVEESDEWLTMADAAGIDLIFLAAPTSTPARLREIAARTRGFIYAVSRLGTTGVQGGLADGLASFLSRLRAVAQTPIAVGFGISNAEHIRALHGQADGVVVGSRLVSAIDAGEDLGEVVRELAEAC